MKPFFSIIIPCCNVGPYIGECLRSILNQPFRDWECLTVIETSRDNTEQIIRDFAGKDSRIRVFTQPRSGSPSMPRNTGIEQAQGQYVMFVDGDDYIFENSLAKLAATISAHPDADLFSCVLTAQDTKTGADEIRDNFRVDDPAEMTGPEAFLLYRDRTQPCPMAQMTIYRRKFLLENKLRFVPGLKYEDGEFSPRALYLAGKVVPVHENFYFYRMAPNSITTTKHKASNLLRHHARKMRSLFEFHTRISREKGYDPNVSKILAKWIVEEISRRWFYPWAIRRIPRPVRGCTLRRMIENGPDDFRRLLKSASLPHRIKGGFILLAARHPGCGLRISDLFFLCFFRLTEFRDTVKHPSGNPSKKP